MELGVSTWGFFDPRAPARWPTLAEAVNSILSIDQTMGVEVWGSRTPDDPPVVGRDLAELVHACEDANSVCVHVRPRYWTWDPCGLRREIDFAHQLGARTLVLHPTCLGLTDIEDHPDWPEIVRIAEYAAKFGVLLAVENLVDSIWCLDRLLEAVGDDPESTNVGICIDVGHAALSTDAGREPVCAYLDRYISQLVHLHLHDNHGEGDDHLIPGNGRIKWPRVLDRIRTIGFSGPAILEVQERGVKPEEVLRCGIEFFRTQQNR